MARAGWIFAGLAALAAMAGMAAANPWVRGYALYHGILSVNGRISGHDEDLPRRASRCSNCHDAVSGNGQTPRVVSPLTGGVLTQSLPRRGGPPSVFDEAGFCAFLRDGVDAAFVQASRTMPRFSMGDADCGALWSYVSSR